MQGLDRRGRVLYLGTFSKSLFPSLRLAYLIVPPTLVDAFVTARTVYDGHSAQLMQAVTAEFIRQGTLPRISATCASSTAAGAIRCWQKFTKNSATSPRPLPPAACSSASGCRPARRRRSADRRSGSASSRPADGAIPDGADAARRLAAGLFGPDAGRDPQRRRAAGADCRSLARPQRNADRLIARSDAFQPPAAGDRSPPANARRSSRRWRSVPSGCPDASAARCR